ncbi:SecY/SEC61-alpha family [Corchorus olitorius]|uniref:SecY/SEC61-alpha family n=1 Tax=Corchorus olitorius TaxID=93759 RepID=A0A1R3KD74_9ROSI|nr:SecY/SEC61-alpha family [Corchorus olitorius]
MAAGVVVEDIEVGFEEAMSCLPSHVLHEAIWETKHNNKVDVKYHYHSHRSKSPPTEPFPPHSKASPRRHVHNKPRYSANWASGGPGMQAFFLDSGPKSCGTGVFLPQKAGIGNNFQSTRRPACSPVLLPSRVVQALNLNVRELGLQISPRRDPKNNTRSGDLNPFNNKNGGKDVSTKRCADNISQLTFSDTQKYLPPYLGRKWKRPFSALIASTIASSLTDLFNIQSRERRKWSTNSSDQLRSDYVNVEPPSSESLSLNGVPSSSDDGADISNFNGVNSIEASHVRPKYFRNRFLNFVRLSSVLNNAAESFFKSEIRRRLFVTAVLLVISRVGYFIPLPGFDRRLIPQDYLSFVSGSVDDLGDFTAELKLSFFQLGISPQIIASILMQVLCHVVPSLVKLRKEGLDGHEKIKSYIWWISLGFAILEAIIVACYSLQYSIYAASYRVKHVMVTAFLLVCGAMTMTWICDTISESGFGQGSSLIICVGILTGYTDTLYKMLTQLSVTMWAVVVTEGCRKIKLQYYGFKLASSAREDSPITEVEPYIPFNINPSGMQPVLTTTYLLAFPSIVARRVTVKCFGNYINHTRSLLAKYQ